MREPKNRRLSLWCFFASALLFIGSLLSWLPLAWPRLVSAPASLLLGPLALYVMAHAGRMLRLGLLLGSIRLRKLLGLYVYTAACSALIPFKLGELVRINEFAWQQAGSYARGLVIVWVERVFDMIAVSAIVLLLVTHADVALFSLAPVLWLTCAFVLATLCFFFVLPEQLGALNLHVIRTYRNEKAVRVLRILEAVNDLSQLARPLLNGRVLTFSLITFFIWAFELLAVGLLMHDLRSWNPLLQLVSQFADIISHGAGHRPSTDAPVSLFDQWKIQILAMPGLISLFAFRYWRRGSASQREGWAR
ncbi:lysylphosphatidylglycerol synthase domain-containing protein [Caballeronia sp. Sq4a]|uniref:lysylphosphatidylglycerol synthase domain-containing protein n=1 Tax=Caballeronia sp. Sq4a TaxID=2878152 RepID=UPI0020C0A479|nr:lysylphosphatidylglycerol synthase domain-containing protein [Caballeronia sp. Sq4a]